uniref:Alpha-2-macroglobulin RAP C-terminal domain-containing protein n=1 Tax=Eptatretus burgeri TaxID=7764 RepID=A0A8C4R422_EPTBU
MGLSPVRLAELHADLRLYEVEHLAWKHSAELEEKPSPDFKLHAILGRYGLDGRKRDAEIFTNRVTDNWDDSTEGEIVFADPKLEKLWMKAHNSHRFDHEELNWLRKEFEHQQQKMDELRSLSRFLSHMNDAPLNVLESGEQTVSPNYLALQEELQQRNHDVEEGLSRLG